MSIIKWKTQDEIEAEELLESLKQSQEEIQNAELEIKILELLMEVMI